VNDTTKRIDSLKRKLIKGLAAKHVENKMAQLLEANYYLQVDSVARATTKLKNIIEKHDVDYRIWQQLFYYESQMEREDSVYKYAKKAVTKFPKEPTAYLFKGIAEKRKQIYDSALSTFSQGLKFIDSGNVSLKQRYYTFIGEIYNNRKEYQKSDSAFQKALSFPYSDNLYLMNNYSYYLSLRGENLDKALSLIKKCIEQEPENPTYLDTYAWVLYKRGEYNSALIQIRKAVKYNEEPNGEILEHYGDILFKNGMEEKALEYWKKAINYNGHSDKLQKKIDTQQLIE
jgi:tetratricopeptide (TPR) repeat protein